MKRLSCCRLAFLVFALLFAICSCTVPNTTEGDQSTTLADTATNHTLESTTSIPEENIVMENTKYQLNHGTKGIKILGERYLTSDKQINCDWTGSGFEMDIVHGGGDISFTASATALCYFRAYVDGEVWMNTSMGDLEYFVVYQNIPFILENVPEGEHTIKIIKVTGYTIARAEITDVTFTGIIKETPPAEKDLYIEFIGDSICCAYGTIGNHQGTYTDQDGTLGYPMLVADSLNADYAVTALSGQGLLMGNPGMTLGYLYGSPLRSTEQEFAFERKADVVVVNIGTNDYANRNNSSYGISETKFHDAYRALLQTILAKYGAECKIVCLYNAMNDTYASQILSVCNELGGNEAGIYTKELTRAADNQHPNIQEHQDYAAVLTPFIKALIEG